VVVGCVVGVVVGGAVVGGVVVGAIVVGCVVGCVVGGVVVSSAGPAQADRIIAGRTSNVIKTNNSLFILSSLIRII
jgi:hypothetical protein